MNTIKYKRLSIKFDSLFFIFEVMKNRVFILLSAFLVLLNSCESDYCFSSGGDIVEKEIKLDFFHSLKTRDVFKIHLKQDTINKITVKTGEKLINEIKFTITDSILILENESSFRWSRSYDNLPEIYLSVKNLSKILIEEPSYITSQNPIKSKRLEINYLTDLAEVDLELDCKNFFFWNVGTNYGKLRLRGNIEKCAIWNYSYANVFTKELNAKRMNVKNHSSGECHVKAVEKLEVSIFGSGNVYCYSKPTETKIEEISSTGKFILK